MTTIKWGDTDGEVTFRFRTDAGPIDLNGKTAYVKLTGEKGATRTITLSVTTPANLGEATWEPSDADYAVLQPDLYSAEGYTLTGANKRRSVPTIGVEQINIEPTL